MGKNVTPEEKLLRVIRKKDKALSRMPRESGESARGAEPGRGSIDEKDTPGSILKAGNRLLPVIVLGLLCYLGIKVWSVAQGKNTFAPAEVMERPASSEALAPAQQISRPAFEQYAQRLTQRDIFQPPWEKRKGEGADDVASGGAVLKQKLRLVGIVLGTDPQAIVEDTASHQTLFMSPGDMLGEAKLESIQEDKVIFQYDDETIELVP